MVECPMAAMDVPIVAAVWDKMEYSTEAADKVTESADKKSEATDIAESGNDISYDRCFYPCCGYCVVVRERLRP
ncbi:hypothetical protein P8452_47460 [Trifolium repens]|nr:hypothetical protein QL285_075996 [Trifolium repens]WJX62468.1 hypothetical protein P8452_47460 [Trifolium repens]